MADSVVEANAATGGHSQSSASDNESLLIPCGGGAVTMAPSIAPGAAASVYLSDAMKPQDTAAASVSPNQRGLEDASAPGSASAGSGPGAAAAAATASIATVIAGQWME